MSSTKYQTPFYQFDREGVDKVLAGIAFMTNWLHVEKYELSLVMVGGRGEFQLSSEDPYVVEAAEMIGNKVNLTSTTEPQLKVVIPRE